MLAALALALMAIPGALTLLGGGQWAPLLRADEGVRDRLHNFAVTHTGSSAQCPHNVDVRPADDFRRDAVPGPIHRRMPENAKETRSSAAFKITARKNLREDGSPKAMRAA